MESRALGDCYGDGPTEIAPAVLRIALPPGHFELGKSSPKARTNIQE